MLPYFFYILSNKIYQESADIAKKFAPIIERGRTNSSVDNLDR